MSLIILSHSYDANVRLFDARNMLKPVSTTSVGGGVWRTKWHPSPNRAGDLLLACMHGGFKVIRYNVLGSGHEAGLSNETGNTVKVFNEHQSLAYGVDWSYNDRGAGDTLVASCSFYDHSLRIWKA